MNQNIAIDTPFVEEFSIVYPIRMLLIVPKEISHKTKLK
jgi:hypothetical protein